MEFTEEIRLARHMKTHKRREQKGSKPKQGTVDFEKPDFSQVNI